MDISQNMGVFLFQLIESLHSYHSHILPLESPKSLWILQSVIALLELNHIWDDDPPQGGAP